MCGCAQGPPSSNSASFWVFLHLDYGNQKIPSWVSVICKSVTKRHSEISRNTLPPFFSPFFLCSRPFLAGAIFDQYFQIPGQTIHIRRTCFDSHSFRGISLWSSGSIGSTTMAREKYLEGRERKSISIAPRKITRRTRGVRATLLPQKHMSSNPGLPARPCFLRFYQFLF